MLGDLVATFSVVQFKNCVLDRLLFIYISLGSSEIRKTSPRDIPLSPWQSSITESETER